MANQFVARIGRISAAFATVLVSGAGLGFAADVPVSGTIGEVPTASQRISDAWELTFAPYFVGANIVGTTQVGRLPATNIDISAQNIIENLHFGAMFRTELMYRQKAGVLVDVAYMKLGSATDILRTGGRARVGVSQLILETMATYRAYNSDNGYFDVYAGSRYWDIALDFNITGSIVGNLTIERGDNWLDPVIGIRGQHNFNEKWSVTGRADIGGFGVGSDFSWNVQAGTSYRINDMWALHLQYKGLWVDYDNDKSGTSSFAYDTITHGPLLGVSATF